MEIVFPKTQQEFLQRQVDEGRYGSVDEAVRAVVRAQEERMEEARRSSDDLQRSIAEGMEAALRGDVVRLDPEKIRREGMGILEEHRRLSGL